MPAVYSLPRKNGRPRLGLAYHASRREQHHEQSDAESDSRRCIEAPEYAADILAYPSDVGLHACSLAYYPPCARYITPLADGVRLKPDPREGELEVRPG